jgi:hypothetical protein
MTRRLPSPARAQRGRTPHAIALFALMLTLTYSVVTPRAGASVLIDRSRSSVSLQVDAAGEALLTYNARGATRHVLAWGGINAVAAAAGRSQTSFALDYAGGWRRHHRAIWTHFRNVCGPYRGPRLAWVVAACTAPDGSHWAVQSWSRGLTDYGTTGSATPDVRLSHWTDAIAHVSIAVDWAYRRFDHLFGRLTYRNVPVYGSRSTSSGVPLDEFGRNVYIDTYNSSYGPGWRRENAILTHRPTGAFCYGFFPHGSHPAGRGTRYRATIIGPGVTPDVRWEGSSPGHFVRRVDRTANAAIRALRDSLCKPN